MQRAYPVGRMCNLVLFLCELSVFGRVATICDSQGTCFLHFCSKKNRCNLYGCSGYFMNAINFFCC